MTKLYLSLDHFGRTSLVGRYDGPYQFVSEQQAKSEARKLIAADPNHYWHIERIEQTGPDVFLVVGDPP
jgi:hypothetical protein